MTFDASWDTHSVFPALHSWSSSRSSSRLQPTDLLYTCEGVETGESGCFKTFRVQDSKKRARQDSCPFGHGPIAKRTSTLFHSWDVSDTLLGTSARRVTTLSFTCNFSQAKPFPFAETGLPAPLVEHAQANPRNPWWTVTTNRGPIAFDTVTALELAFGISNRLAHMLFSPFLGAGMLHWRANRVDHLWLRAPLPAQQPLTRPEATCASYWLGDPAHLAALEATSRSLMTTGPLRMPHELEGVTCDASGIFVNGVVFVQAFAPASRKAFFPFSGDSLVLIDNAETLRGGVFECTQTEEPESAKPPQLKRRHLTHEEVDAALKSRTSASSISAELSPSEFELLASEDTPSLWGPSVPPKNGKATKGPNRDRPNPFPLSSEQACEMLLEEFGRTHKLLLQALSLHSAGARPQEAELFRLWEECSRARTMVAQIEHRLVQVTR